MDQYLYSRFRGVPFSINKWWKTRSQDYKIRVVSKKEFELVKMQTEKRSKNYSLVNFDAEYLIYAAIIDLLYK